MYEDVGIRKEIAMQKLHRVMNEETRYGLMSSLALIKIQMGEKQMQLKTVQNLHQSFSMC